MSAVGITENVKGDMKKFEVWYNGREEVYIIQVCWRRTFVFFLPLTGGKYILYIFFCTGYFTFKNTSTQLTVEMNWSWTCRVWTKHHLVRNSCTVSSIRETSDGFCSDRNINLFIWHYWPNNPSDFSEVGTTGRNHLTVSEALFLKTKPRLYVLHFCEHCLQCLQKYTCKHWLRRPRLPALSV